MNFYISNLKILQDRKLAWNNLMEFCQVKILNFYYNYKIVDYW